MSKFAAALETYKKEMTDTLGMKSVNDDLLKAVTKACGPSIYNADACKVSSSDQTELDRVKNNFLVKKLGLADGPELDKAITDVVEKFGSSNRNKYRAIFYYLLVVAFKKESQFV